MILYSVSNEFFRDTPSARLIYILGFQDLIKLFLPGGRKMSTIQEFSSDDLMDARDPPLSSHIF